MELMKNPFISDFGTNVGFKVSGKTLWWTGSGFKDLVSVEKNPYEFANAAEAEQFILSVAIPFIHQWRPDQVNLILGW